MTQLSKNALIAKYNDSLNGLYKAGQNLGIGSSSHRTLVQDLMDSLVGFDDQQSGSIPIVQLFYPTVGIGTTTAEYDWDSSYQNIGLLTADYDDITIDFQNRVVGSQATLFVIKTISGDVVLTIPSMQAVGDTTATTAITLSGATDTIFRIDFFTTANGGFIQIAEPDDTYRKIIHVSESVVWAVDTNKIYKSTNNGVTFSLIYTVTPNTVGYTTSIVDFDISGVYIWIVSQEIDVNGTGQSNKIIGSDDTGATFGLSASSPLGSSQLVTSVAIYSGTEVFFGANSTGTVILYGNTSTGGDLLFGNIVSGVGDLRAAVEFAMNTDLFVLHSSTSTFANQISKRTSAGTFTKTATAPPDTCKLLSIDFATSTLGIVVGYDASSEPIIYKTTDAGATWTAETINSNIGILRRVRAVSATSFICVGDSGIGYSTDSGDTWQYFETPTSGVSLSAWDANDILIGSSNPYLWKGFGSSVPDIYHLHKPDLNTDTYFFQQEDFVVSNGGLQFNSSGDAGWITDGQDATEKAIGVYCLDTFSPPSTYPAIFGGSSFAAFGNGNRVRIRFRLGLSNLSDGTDTFTVYAGTGDNTGSGDNTDGMYFKYTHGTNSGKWQAVTASNSTRTATDSTVTAVTNFCIFEIDVAADLSSVSFLINGIQVNNTTNIPSGTSRTHSLLFKIEQTLGTNRRYVYLDWFELLITRTTPR